MTRNERLQNYNRQDFIAVLFAVRSFGLDYQPLWHLASSPWVPQLTPGPVEPAPPDPARCGIDLLISPLYTLPGICTIL